ncbi:MAG TPA: UDP-N-acetylglucosamine 1-carboxyvinyltransferase, partial [Candidatus Methylomirabilis sp.]|nr:UDP-N-acetylglucosamine 1-carboxyvinyltransferase [Candidatus Methylomirabilis sp.]
MDQLRIRGGVPLRGSVRVSGAKNAALPCITAGLLAEGELRLTNVPRLKDIETICRLLRHMGVAVEADGAGGLAVSGRAVSRFEAPYELVRTMRASVLVLGPLVARFGRARVSLPGGCAIGPRPINLHLAGLKQMGAEIDLSEGYVEAKARRLRGTRIVFDVKTVTGTENLLMAAVLAEGTTVLENAACEPEVQDLAALLVAMGARIGGAGTDTITVEGAQALGAASHRIIADRIEAGTFAAAAAITRGDVTLTDCAPEHMEAVLGKLREAGAQCTPGPGGLRVQMGSRPAAVNVQTAPYPGFATDMQAQLMALMSVAEGRSVITETVFENRFMHVNELLRMGADVKIAGRAAVVQGVPRLRGAPVMATDLRASASLVLAGLVAEGTTVVHRIYHLDRGYETI